MKYNFDKCENFIAKEVDLEDHGCKVIGYFPYSTAKVGQANSCVSIPRSVIHELEHTLQQKHILNDNKVVVIFQDTTNFGTENFAIQFKDLFAKIGSWDDVLDYDGYELKEKK